MNIQFIASRISQAPQLGGRELHYSFPQEDMSCLGLLQQTPWCGMAEGRKRRKGKKEEKKKEN